jgi:hypothetical protein
VRFVFAAAGREVSLQAAARGMEGLRDRDVDVVVDSVIAGVSGDREDFVWNDQLDPDMEQRVALLVMKRNADDHAGAEDIGGDATQPFEPSTNRHLRGHVVRHSTELNIDLHALGECRARARERNSERGSEDDQVARFMKA